jgi:hypothetical protein
MVNLPHHDALILCGEILNLLQSDTSKLSTIIERAHRLAVLVDDPRAEFWLRLEQQDHNMYGPSQPELGARLVESLGSHEAARAYALEVVDVWLKERSTPKIKLVDGVLTRVPGELMRRGSSVAGIEELNDTLLASGADALMIRMLVGDNQAILDRIRLRVQDYLYRTESSLRARVAAVTAIEGAAKDIERLISRHASEVLPHLQAADGALRASGVDGPAHALLSLRRALLVLADRVYPAIDTGPVKCSDGKVRDLSHEKYNNRILEFVGKSQQSKSRRKTTQAEVEHVAQRLDAVYVQQNKGVHEYVTLAEAQRVVARTYFIIGDVLDLLEG